MVDQLWHKWQLRRPENSLRAFSFFIPCNNGQAYLSSQFGAAVPGDGLLNNATAFELMDTQNYDFCYSYL